MVIDGFSNLKHLPDSLGELVEMTKLSMSYCHKLENIPDTLGKLPDLQVGVGGGGGRCEQQQPRH